MIRSPAALGEHAHVGLDRRLQPGEQRRHMVVQRMPLQPGNCRRADVVVLREDSAADQGIGGRRVWVIGQGEHDRQDHAMEFLLFAFCADLLP